MQTIHGIRGLPRFFLSRKKSGESFGDRNKGNRILTCQAKMFKELRELVSFALGLLTDTFQLVRMSVLSRSSSLGLGKDAATALHLSAVVFIIVLSIFVATVTTEPPKFDLWAFSVICVAYFAIVSFLVYALINFFQRGRPRAANGNNWDGNVDAKSYVLAFNLVALSVFALMREIQIFRHDHNTADNILSLNIRAGIPAIVVGCLVMLLVARKERSAVASNLSVPQKLFAASVLTASFLIYVALAVPT